MEMSKVSQMLKINKVLVIIVLITAGWFYWFQYRPQQIRKNCLGQVRKWATESKEYTTSRANARYRICIIESGMKGEDLVN